MKTITKDDILILKKDFDFFTTQNIIEQCEFLTYLFFDCLLISVLEKDDDFYFLNQKVLLVIFQIGCKLIRVNVEDYLGGSNE